MHVVQARLSLRCLAAGVAPAPKVSPVRRGKNTAKAEEPITNKKLSALRMAIAQIEHSHGKGSLMKFGDRGAGLPKVDIIPTGSLTLDHALGEWDIAPAAQF